MHCPEYQKRTALLPELGTVSPEIVNLWEGVLSIARNILVGWIFQYVITVQIVSTFRDIGAQGRLYARGGAFSPVTP